MVLPYKKQVGNTYKDNGTKSLFFKKLDGGTGLSKKQFKVVPNAHNKRVIIYYIEKDNETNKFEYTVFFNKEDILFSKSKSSLSLKNKISYKDITEIGNEKHKIRNMFEDTGTYMILFVLFFTLSRLSNNRILGEILNKRLIYTLQMIIIFIFLFGGDQIIRTEDSSCYQSPYTVEGKVDYFINDPYVKFVDCYGHKSKSKRKNPELLGKAKNESVQIYYNHSTRDYYSNDDINVYRVYTSESAYEKESETPFRLYFGLLLLFIFLYSYFMKEKKLYLPSFLGTNNNKIYSYMQEKKSFSELLEMLDKEYFEIGTLDEYFVDPIVYTINDKQIAIERFKLFEVLIPGILALGFLGLIFNAFFGNNDIDISTFTYDDKAIMGIMGLFGMGFLYIAIKNFTAKKRVGLFDIHSRTYTAYLEDKIVSFDDIYGYIITPKTVSNNSSDIDRNYRIDLFELDMVLTNGKVVNLYAREKNRSQIYKEAKIIASYTNKPMYDFAHKDINEVFRIEKIFT